jgi:iron complex transport system substrate-binding protein
MRAAAALCALLLAAACGRPPDPGRADRRLVLFGPSLTETVFAMGAGSLVVGVDRYSKWPPAADSLPEVGGYLDPSMEQVAALEPTAIHSVGNSPQIEELAEALGAAYHSWSFDTLEDALESMQALDSMYAGVGLAGRVRARLDSLRRAAPPVSVALVVSHTPGSGSVTLAGDGTFLGGLAESIGASLSAPSSSAYPRVSLEGVLELAPDHLVYLLPDHPDPEGYAARVEDLWEGMGIDGERVHVLTDEHLLVPGPRMGRTAERIAECLRS